MTTRPASSTAFEPFARSLMWTPKVKDRPRNGRGHTYTPRATLDAEAALARQWVDAGWPCFEGPITLEADLYGDHIDVRIDRCEPYLNRSLRGDTDNYLKLILDALNGVAYIDDRQIVRVVGEKK